MPDETDGTMAERSAPDRPRPDLSALRIPEALEISRAEPMTPTATLAIADEMLKAAQLRHEYLLENPAKRAAPHRALMIGSVPRKTVHSFPARHNLPLFDKDTFALNSISIIIAIWWSVRFGLPS